VERIRRNTMGWRLLKEREKRGWTQREIAERVGITPSAVSQYERNHHEPPLRYIEGFAEAYGVGKEYLLDGVELQVPRTPVEVQFLNLLRKTPPEKHEAMLAVMRVTARYAAGAKG
jgi:transcriptional regulator with XRE-family HTH domain